MPPSIVAAKQTLSSRGVRPGGRRGICFLLEPCGSALSASLVAQGAPILGGPGVFPSRPPRTSSIAPRCPNLTACPPPSSPQNKRCHHEERSDEGSASRLRRVRAATAPALVAQGGTAVLNTRLSSARIARYKKSRIGVVRRPWAFPRARRARAQSLRALPQPSPLRILVGVVITRSGNRGSHRALRSPVRGDRN